MVTEACRQCMVLMQMLHYHTQKLTEVRLSSVIIIMRLGLFLYIFYDLKKILVNGEWTFM